ncbi:MAG: DUF2550 domain-containing protein [Micropruina sp.]
MDVISALEWLLIVVVLVLVAAVAGFWLRRQWLSREGGSFACSFHPAARTPGTRWVLGVARYRDHELQWFPAFSLSVWPKQRFNRGVIKAGDQRVPDSAEASWLLEGQRIVSLHRPADQVELAMAPDSLTGLLSWLEAAPPGMRYLPSPTSPE